MLISINTKGKFTFKEPLNSIIAKDLEYEVVAIRTIKELIDTDDDPLNTVYVPIGLSEDIYREDVKNNINIITLSPVEGNTYNYIPESYIVGAPDTAGYPYAETLLAVNLGKMPIDFDMTTMKDEITQIIKELYGLEVEVAKTNTSAVEIFSEVDNALFQRKLKYATFSKETIRVKYAKLLELYNNRFDYTELINDSLGVKLELGEVVLTEEP